VSLAEGIANVALSVVLVRKYGMVGVAWGTVIPNLVTTFVLSVYTLRILGLNPQDYLLKAYLRPVLCGVPVAALCYAFSIGVRTPTWVLFGAEVATVIALFSALSYFICLDREQRASVVLVAYRKLNRERVVHEA
jgi:Na+-driven multidrug efflux pump